MAVISILSSWLCCVFRTALEVLKPLEQVVTITCLRLSLGPLTFDVELAKLWFFGYTTVTTAGSRRTGTT